MATCTHLDQIIVDRPDRVDGCEDCLKIGGTMGAPAGVPHLRPHRLLRFLAQPPRQPTRGESDHPIVTSVEPGEYWSYCYVDNVAFVLETRA